MFEGKTSILKTKAVVTNLRLLSCVTGGHEMCLIVTLEAEIADIFFSNDSDSVKKIKDKRTSVISYCMHLINYTWRKWNPLSSNQTTKAAQCFMSLLNEEQRVRNKWRHRISLLAVVFTHSCHRGGQQMRAQLLIGPHFIPGYLLMPPAST